MLKSKIQFINNAPLINIDGALYPPLAYTTYFNECGKWSDFIKSGYKMFFVNISFNDLPINNVTGFTPFRTGVFEKSTPDYSEFQKTIHHILQECPHAFIFPRIHISMPRKWIAENPYETVETPNGGYRESLFSDKFKNDGARLLASLINHIQTSDYSHRIAGYQLCGGTTQEWIHHDLFGSYSAMGIEKFKNRVYEKHGIKSINPPQKSDFSKNDITKETSLYYRFCCEETAHTIEYFAKKCKEFINNEQIVGVFYGYNGFVRDPLWGLHGLGEIINSPYIDFFSSPCCYDDARNLGLDWGDMLPVDSIKLHNKLCFIECDVRTYLTKRMQDSRPGEYPESIMPLTNEHGNRTVWKGPETLDLSISAIRKAFAHQLVKGSGIWWFDMWGGWYSDATLMHELTEMHKICTNSINTKTLDLPCSEVALFIDEKAYSSIPRSSQLSDTVNAIRVAMGNTGIPFDTFMVEDAQSVARNYKTAVFTSPTPSESGLSALKHCKDNGIPCIIPNKEKYFFSTPELRDILTSEGIHCYNSDNNVIYCSNGFLGIHTQSDGNFKIKLPYTAEVIPLLGNCLICGKTDTITVSLPRHSTLLFQIKQAE